MNLPSQVKLSPWRYVLWAIPDMKIRSDITLEVWFTLINLPKSWT